MLISAYNGKKYIEAQIDSILAQKDVQVHIYVRDDGSTDDTVSFLESRYAETPLEVIRGENLGHGGSFYELVRLADTGDYWAFSDQDDVWLPEKLSAAASWMKEEEAKTPGVPLLYHSAYECRNEDLSEVLYSYLPPQKEIRFAQAVTDSVFQGFSIVFNRSLRELFLKAKREEVSSHDWLMGMIALAYGKTYFDSRIGAYHRRLMTSQSGMDMGNRLKWLGDTWMHPERSDIRRTARAFVKTYGEELSAGTIKQQKAIQTAKWFCRGYSVHTLQKLFYPHRWRPSFSSEVVLRFLILCGKI